MDLQDKSRGCLIGGAAGDALGYEVEFDRLSSILRQFGPDGITEYVLHKGKAVFSDDTQMTLFTADGLLHDGADRRANIRLAYLAWYHTQRGFYPPGVSETPDSPLLSVPELCAWRAPGNTCLSAIEMGCSGTIESPVNHSKGCGGVMRVAPIGLAVTDERECIRLGAEAAALTHGHPLGWLPAAGLAHMVRLLAHEGAAMREAAADMLRAVQNYFPDAEYLEDFLSLMETAVRLADSAEPVRESISRLGEGWVGEEALAIALYCALKFEEDFAGGLIASVNHNGDSDSTGAVAGNLLGARLGLSGIPERFRTDLELYDLLTETADKLI